MTFWRTSSRWNEKCWTSNTYTSLDRMLRWRAIIETYVDRQFIMYGKRSSWTIFIIWFKTSNQFLKKTPFIWTFAKGHTYRNCHSGRKLTLNHLREKFWIIPAESLVRRILLNCSYCKRQRILPTPGLMTDLPGE